MALDVKKYRVLQDGEGGIESIALTDMLRETCTREHFDRSNGKHPLLFWTVMVVEWNLIL